MKISEFSNSILKGGSLEDKLTSLETPLTFDEYSFTLPKRPVRDDKIKMSSANVRFPKGHFHEVEKKAIALHSFANHELLAIEMMACALSLYPHKTLEQRKFKLGIVSALKDEQKHLKLYVDRLNELGYEFGDFPLNDFFWGQMPSLKTPEQYLCVMSLTFEAANLDFAHYYQHIFKELGDDKTAMILQTVLDDEISHVAFGVHFLNKWRKEKSLWQYYNESLPYPMTPARGKGKNFIKHVRLKAKMDNAFIEKIQNYKDDFKVTHRKEWKSLSS